MRALADPYAPVRGTLRLPPAGARVPADEAHIIALEGGSGSRSRGCSPRPPGVHGPATSLDCRRGLHDNAAAGFWDNFIKQLNMPHGHVRTRALPAILAAAVLSFSGGATGVALAQSAPDDRALLTRYCVGCHNDRTLTAGVSLQGVDFDRVGEHAGEVELWERVIRKLRTRAMPPAGRPRPSEGQYEGVVARLETAIDAAAAADPNPGRRPAVHRLNRAEYANAIRDLLALDVDTRTLLPADDSGFGFDNIADVLSVSPMLTERYLSAARKISRLAVGDPNLAPSTEIFTVDKYLKQDARVSDDLPFGSRGGLAVRHTFPVDGEYVVKIYLARTYDGRLRGLANRHEMEVRLDGAPRRDAHRGRPRPRRVGRRAAAGLPELGRRRAGGALHGSRRPPPARGDLRRPGGGARRHAPAALRGHELRVRRRPEPRPGHRPHRAAGALRRHRPRRHAEPPHHVRVPAPGRRGAVRPRGGRVRPRDPGGARAPRVPPAARRRRPRHAARLLPPRGARAATSTPASRWPCAGCS